jgi:hypothetical protein
MNLPSEKTAKPRNEAFVQYNWAGKEKKAKKNKPDQKQKMPIYGA